jgi:hypothetical protein
LEIVQYVTEVKKPDGERLPQYHEAGLESLKFQLLSPAPIYPSNGKALHEDGPEPGEGKTGQDDAYLQAIVQGGDVDKAVDALVDGTKLGDPAFRKSLLDGGEAAVAASTDPMIVAARRADPMWRANYRTCATSVGSVFDRRRKLGKARFAGLWQGRVSRRHIHAAPELRHGRRLSLQRNHRAAVHHVLRALRSRGQLQQQAAVRPDAQRSRRRATSSTWQRRSISSAPTTSSAATPARRWSIATANLWG